MRSSEQTTYSRVLLHSLQYTLNILSKLLYHALFNSFELLSYCILAKRIQLIRFELGPPRSFPPKQANQSEPAVFTWEGLQPMRERIGWTEFFHSFGSNSKARLAGKLVLLLQSREHVIQKVEHLSILFSIQ